jgi:predicted kinase
VRSRLIHLNGPPGIGKSTLARRYAADHHGVLACDIDVLRTMLGGWREDFPGAGRLIRPVALAVITAHLAQGHDVVMPQLIGRAEEMDLFEAAAGDAGAETVHSCSMTRPRRCSVAGGTDHPPAMTGPRIPGL